MEATAKLACEARLAAVKAFYAAGGNLQQAVRDIEGGWNVNHGETDPSHIRGVRQFIRYNVNKLESQYTLLTSGSSGRPPILSDEEVRQIAEIVGHGHWVKTMAEIDGRYHDYLHWRHYTSIREVIMQDTHLNQLCTERHISAEYIRRRLHEVVPQLHYGPMPMKDVLPEAVMKQRVVYANNMLFRLQVNPDFLSDVYFMDECRIWVGRNLQGKLMVWSFRGDFEGEPPVPNELLGKHKGFKINLLLVVNARRGVVWKEFLSGTVGMADDDRHNPEMVQVMRDRGGGPYKVSGLNTMQFDVASISHFAACSLLAIHSTQLCWFPSHHNDTSLYCIVSITKLASDI